VLSSPVHVQVGFVFTDFFHISGFDFTTLEAHDACVASGAMSQLLLWLGLLEVFGFIGIDQTLRGSGRAAGDFSFDPLGFGSDPAKMATLQMKELANGRLAMFAFSGEQAHRLHHASWPRTSHVLGRLMLRARIPLCRHGDPVGPHRQ